MEERDREDEVPALRGEIAALRQENALLRQIIEAVTVGVQVVDAEGKELLYNGTVRAMLGSSHSSADTPEDRIRKYGIFEADGISPLTLENAPTGRALRGERVDGWEGIIRHSGMSKDELRVVVSSRPLLDEEGRPGRGAVTTVLDVSEARRMARESEARRAALEASEAAREELVARLRAAIDELETPVLQVGKDTLVVPVIGVVDSQRSARMTTRLLDEVSRLGAAYVIVDWTGVDIVDTATAASFLDMARAVGLLGARCVLTGLRPAVAQTLVDLGVSFGGIPTLRNLAQGLDHCARASRGHPRGPKS